MMYHMEASLKSTAADIKTKLQKKQNKTNISNRKWRLFSSLRQREQLTETDLSNGVFDKFRARYPKRKNTSCHKEEELQHQPQQHEFLATLVDANQKSNSTQQIHRGAANENGSKNAWRHGNVAGQMETETIQNQVGQAVVGIVPLVFHVGNGPGIGLLDMDVGQDDNEQQDDGNELKLRVNSQKSAYEQNSRIQTLTNWLMQMSTAERRMCFGRIGDFRIFTKRSKHPGWVCCGSNIFAFVNFCGFRFLSRKLLNNVPCGVMRRQTPWCNEGVVVKSINRRIILLLGLTFLVFAYKVANCTWIIECTHTRTHKHHRIYRYVYVIGLIKQPPLSILRGNDDSKKL